MNTVYVILLILAVVCFAAAAAEVKARINLIAAGLFFWVLVPLIQHLR